MKMFAIVFLLLALAGSIVPVSSAEAVAARQPEKYDTSKPITIPFGLKDLSTTDHVIHGEN
jgi:hypothetical protein